MRPQAATSIAGLGAAGVVTPNLISPRAADTYRLGPVPEQINFVAAFGALTDVLSPTAPIATISKVEFLDGVTVVATANAFPWIAYVSAATLGAGAHSVSCRVTYANGAVRSSAAKSITVAAAPATNLGSFAAVKLWADGTDASKYTPANPVPGTTFISALANNQGAAVFSDFTQATGARQPTVDYVRGNLCLLFGTGAQQHIDTNITGTVAQPWQALHGYRQCGSGTTGTIWAGSTGGNFKINGSPSDWAMDGVLNANVALTAPAAFPDSTSHAMAFQASASGYINVDLVDLATGTTGSRQLQTLLSLGAGSTGAGAVFAGIAEFAIATALSGADQTTAKAELNAKLHTTELAAKRFDQMDSLGIGTQSTTGMGWRPMIWFGSKAWSGSAFGTTPWAFSQAKTAGRWVESGGPINTGGGGFPGFIDDQTYCNSGKGINFAIANVGNRINAGQPYQTRNITVFNWGAANARNLAGETFVPGTGPGSTFDSWVQAAIISADAGSMLGMVWLNLIDCDPAQVTYAANLRTMNGYWQQAIAAVRAARPAFQIVPVDQFNYLGLFVTNPARWNIDGVHLSDLGYPIYGLGIGQGLAQLCALITP